MHHLAACLVLIGTGRVFWVCLLTIQPFDVFEVESD
ncbi:hypothetical protein AF72_02455 [Xylella taiwanensis]|uniref:Uncharacterized protein n=1 Tax=Xylella taiwanensis TaxID=1444770 RepID=Z9JMX7_9GAMM|nr:hypothetical protein AF72_02455 [Xylella taiwanensis]